MKRNEALIFVAFALFLFSTNARAPAEHRGAAQESRPHTAKFGEKLQTAVPEFEAAGRPMAVLAVDIAYRYKLPMAIEHVGRGALREPLHLRLRGQSVRRVIAAIVAFVPGYRVDFSRGLVDIYSPAARRDPANPFNMLISRYDADGLDTHFVDAWLNCDIGRQLHGHSGCGGSIAPGQWGNRRVTLHLRDKRVYEILNAIVAQNGRALWVPIPPPRESSPMISGNFWYSYPLDPPFERAAIGNLQMLVPLQQGKPSN